jgi:hypothetical protein
LLFAADRLGYPTLLRIHNRASTPELRPPIEVGTSSKHTEDTSAVMLVSSEEEQFQSSEKEMGLSFDELSIFGKFRKSLKILI